MKPTLTTITLGVRDFAASVRFYQALGFARRVRATGDEVAFFDAGGVVLALYHWHLLAGDALLPEEPPPQGFRGTTLAWNCASITEVDKAMTQALAAGATLLKPAHKTPWGGYSGYVADPDGHPWEIVHAPMFPLDPQGRLVMPE